MTIKIILHFSTEVQLSIHYQSHVTPGSTIRRSMLLLDISKTFQIQYFQSASVVLPLYCLLITCISFLALWWYTSSMAVVPFIMVMNCTKPEIHEGHVFLFLVSLWRHLHLNMNQQFVHFLLLQINPGILLSFNTAFVFYIILRRASLFKGKIQEDSSRDLKQG